MVNVAMEFQVQTSAIKLKLIVDKDLPTGVGASVVLRRFFIT
jgi:hypothetical protein